MDNFETPKEDPVDQDLEYARSKRKQIINALTEKGIPKEESTISILLGALSDMDRVSLGRKKIKADSDVAANNKQAADLIASIFNMPNSKKIGNTEDDGTVGTIPKVADLLPKVDIIPGEMDVNPSQLDYESFMSKVEK